MLEKHVEVDHGFEPKPGELPGSTHANRKLLEKHVEIDHGFELPREAALPISSHANLKRHILQDQNMALPALPSEIKPPFVAATWGWDAQYPAGAQVCVKLQPRSGQDRLKIDVFLQSSEGVELACGRASIPPKRQFLRIFWIGRSRCQPVHQSVRGKPMHETHSEGTNRQVTAAVALLGSLVAIARLWQVETVSLQDLDSGSGALRHYLCSMGFHEPADKPSPKDTAQGLLVAPAAVLASRCCPQPWQSEIQQRKANFMPPIC